MLTISVLGPPTVTDSDGNDLTPPGSRETHALIALALVAPESVSTERLAHELYRDRPPSDPRNAVQAVVSRLRRALGRRAGSIETTATGYRAVDVEVDLDEAESLLRQVASDDDRDEAARAFDHAGRLWRGSTLDGLHGPAIDAERLRIDGLRLDAEDALLARRVAGPSASGTEPGMLTEFEDAARAEPLRERRWELLMIALYRSGRQADALRVYQEARAHLAEELGLEPGPDLAGLEQRILAHDPTLQAPSPADDRSEAAEPEAAHVPPITSESRTAAPNGTGNEPVELPSGTVSVLLCDVEGSVRRWEQAPTDTASAIAGMHDIWTTAVADADGHLVKSTGDGVMAVFATASDAIRAAIAGTRIQGETELSVRVAVHTGSMTPVERDYRGPVVNRCARLLDLANGGQILATATTAELARTDVGPSAKVAGPIDFRDLGLQWLRDVPDPVAIVQVEGAGLRTSFPPLRSSGPRSLPRLRASLVGRSGLVAEALDRIGDGPLVTLLGPGGIGKTSLALAAGWETAPHRPVCFIDLAGESDPRNVADRIADELAPSEHDDRPAAERIADRLRTGTDLAIVDNAEHLLDAVAETLEPVLAHDLKGSFLVTSRQPLGLVGEEIVAVPPLSLPEEAADLADTGLSPAVQLFTERVRSARPDFEIPNGLLPVVAHICRRLDGIPLAIELAAGRAALLSLDDIAARLDDQLRLLRQVRSSRTRRHRSLEAVVGWSIDQLTPGTRELFDRLAVMAGGFGLAGVERLAELCDLDVDPLDGLDELQAASLIVVEPGGSRFRMLEPIRQVAEAELRERGLELETRRAHARWLIGLVERAHRLRDERRVPAAEIVDVESHHLLAAMRWIAQAEQADLAVAIAFPSSFWFLSRDARIGGHLLSDLIPLVDRGQDPEGWAGLVVAVAAATAAQPMSTVADDAPAALDVLEEAGFEDLALACVAVALSHDGSAEDSPRILELLSRAERLASSDDRWATAVVDLATMAMQGLLVQGGAPGVSADEAVTRGERAAATFRQFGERWTLGLALGELGRIHKTLGNLEQAESNLLESIGLFAESDEHAIHYLYTELGRLATIRGEHRKADDYHHRSVEIARIDGNAACLSDSFAGLAESAEAQGERDRAYEHYLEAARLADERSLFSTHGRSEWHDALERLRPEGDRASNAD